MRNSDNVVIFECDNPLVLCTRRVSSLFELKSLILSNLGGLGRKEWIRPLDLCAGYTPLAPPSIHVASPVEDMDVGDEDSDKEYVADSNDIDSSEDDDEQEFVPETSAEAAMHYMLTPPSPPHPIGTIRCTRSVEYRVIKSNQLKYHVHYRQAATKCPWSLRVSLRQNLGYWEVRRVGGAHTCLAPTMSQDHRQLDSSLICKVILPLIQSNPFVSIPVLKVWMAKQKTIAQIYRDWEESYNKVLKLLQALQSCCPRTICELRAVPYYEGHLMVRELN
ncbi:hypothetical protein Ahy_B01g052321 [Arachis hypogaea]|uniref:Transposase MuDR plant domain-containing protein n=1 Tax=Arachis hypogaea TaxID=3818 RepID=A0A445AP80_ARAHY|nr:hypothetical protein Ahy_B01g052321 [Arachis hypogaea]